VVRRPATYQEILALPEHLVGEIIDGELIVSPRPASKHAFASTVLTMDLGAPYMRGRGGPGGWWILDEPELHFGRDVLVPDLAGWRRTRMESVPDVPFFTLAPDWICEVLSPSTANIDRARKLRIYAREEVGHAWLIDPAVRTLEVLRRHEKSWLLVTTFSDRERVRAEPFDAVELDLGALWPPPPRKKRKGVSRRSRPARGR
jgi:Uma2 family endonuclease